MPGMASSKRSSAAARVQNAVARGRTAAAHAAMAREEVTVTNERFKIELFMVFLGLWRNEFTKPRQV